jgi:hypothetical protein
MLLIFKLLWDLEISCFSGILHSIIFRSKLKLKCQKHFRMLMGASLAFLHSITHCLLLTVLHIAYRIAGGRVHCKQTGSHFK